MGALLMLDIQQWQGLIAINYPARSFGLSRHITITEAKKLCPNLIMQHVATWKEGDEKWAYHEHAFEGIHSHKVSLDPYRLESRKILATIKDLLPPPPTQRVEKAGIDEVFLDLSAQIHSILLERYPELRGPAPYDDPSENLPRPPTTALDWNTDAVVDLNTDETEDDDPDWDDIAILVGSEIVRSVRGAIRDDLKYTCSAGIAHNKFIAKLGSGHKKPNQQTIVRNRAIQFFLSGFKFTKIRNLGGKLGDQVVATFGTDTVKDLLGVSLATFKSKFGDDTGTWIYQTIRGIDLSEVNSRTQIKSMLSAKSFRPSINTFEQGVRWLRIFVADIYSRLVEEGVLTNKRRPKSINLHHRQGAQMRSRQAPIPSGRPIDEALLFDLAKNLLGQVVVDGRAWPCANLQLSVGGFEDGISGNRGIGGFLVRGEEAKAMQSTIHDDENPTLVTESDRGWKRRKVDDGGIQRFFAKEDGKEENDDSCSALNGVIKSRSDNNHYNARGPSIDNEPAWGDSAMSEAPTNQEQAGRSDGGKHCQSTEDENRGSPEKSTFPPRANTKMHTTPAERGRDIQTAVAANIWGHLQLPATDYLCQRCRKTVPLFQRDEHEDWHFAKDLHEQERARSSGPSLAAEVEVQQSCGTSRRSSSNAVPATAKKSGGSSTASGNGAKRIEKGQSRLAFGR